MIKTYHIIIALMLFLNLEIAYGQIKPDGREVRRLFPKIDESYMKGLHCPTDSTERMLLMENTVLKNIYSYRLLMLDVKDYNLFRGTFSERFDIDSLLPNYDYKLMFDIQRYDSYGNHKYTYAFHKDKDQYTNGEHTYTSTYFNEMLPHDNYFLVSFDTLTCEVGFLSGNFFLSVFRYEELKLTDTIPEIRQILNYRLFKYQVRDIEYLRFEDKMYVYKGYSDVLESPILIFIEPYSPIPTHTFDYVYPDKIFFKYYTKEEGKYFEYKQRIIRAPKSIEEVSPQRVPISIKDIPNEILTP